MSHTIKLENVLLNIESVQQALENKRFNGWKVEQVTNFRFYDGTTVSGLKIDPPTGWRFPIMLREDGSLLYDTYNGCWGKAEDVSDLVAMSLACEAGYNLDDLVIENVQNERVYTFA